MIRNYQFGDHIAIAEIFSRAIHETASEVYSEEQCGAWSAKASHPGHWEARCEQKNPFVFVAGNRVIGFCELDAEGHIDCTYVHPAHGRKGVASRLVSHAVDAARSRGLRKVCVEASICAQPMFARLGFVTIKKQTVEIRGVGLENFQMEKLCG
ncbi:GNAT family N-acetyltransferase [Kiritimatiellaeota bacterium B1221]|nr:GNAT family N-acetyltransferase [Kiritimatiellaeota bacterium B1221]